MSQQEIAWRFFLYGVVFGALFSILGFSGAFIVLVRGRTDNRRSA